MVDDTNNLFENNFIDTCIFIASMASFAISFGLMVPVTHNMRFFYDTPGASPIGISLIVGIGVVVFTFFSLKAITLCIKSNKSFKSPLFIIDYSQIKKKAKKKIKKETKKHKY